MAKEASEQLLADVKSFLEEEQYSDLTITCGQDTYKVHRIVVCTRCDFFAKAVKFPVGTEAEQGRIDLPKDDPAIVKLLIDYLYKAEYEPRLRYDATPPDTRVGHTCNSISVHPSGAYMRKRCPSIYVCPHHHCGSQCKYNCRNFICDTCQPAPVPPTVNGRAEQLLTHAKMYEIADKYDVPGLAKLSKCKFQIACGMFSKHPEFPEAANYAFSTTPDEDKGLRDIVCRTISKNMWLLKEPAVEALMLEFNGLAYGLLKEKAENHGWLGEDDDSHKANDDTGTW